MKYLSITALALAGAIVISCGTDDDIVENAPQQQLINKDNIVVVKTTVGLADNQTKALNIDYVNKVLDKTFAVGDQIHLEYRSGSGSDVAYAVSKALTEDDIIAGGKSATFTFELVDPQTCEVELTYPASMLDAAGEPIESMFTDQDGTLANVADLDLSFKISTLNIDKSTGNTIDAVTLENRTAIVAYTLKNAAGTDITSTITGFTVNDGDYTYTVTRSATAGPIYVALYGVKNKDIEYTAQSSTQSYKKFVSNKTYASGGFYQQGLLMGTLVDLSKVGGACQVQNGDVLTGTLSGNYKISVADGATVTLDNATITDGVTSVTAKKGTDALHSVGKGQDGTCGTITIGGEPTSGITTSPYNFQP